MAVVLENLTKSKLNELDNAIFERGVYFNTESRLWHVPYFVSSTSYEHTYWDDELNEEIEFIHNESVREFAEKHKKQLIEVLEIRNGDSIEFCAVEKDIWEIYNKRNGRTIYIYDLTTWIGADDGHCDFVTAWAMAFQEFEEVEFSIPHYFETYKEVQEFLKWMIDDDL